MGYLYGGTARVDGMAFGNSYVQRNARIDRFAKVYDNANIGDSAVLQKVKELCIG